MFKVHDQVIVTGTVMGTSDADVLVKLDKGHQAWLSANVLRPLTSISRLSIAADLLAGMLANTDYQPYAASTVANAAKGIGMTVKGLLAADNYPKVLARDALVAADALIAAEAKTRKEQP